MIFGDFNFQPDSRAYNLVVDPTSDYSGHITSNCGYVDAWCQCGHDKFLGVACDVNGVPARLDYCFVSCTLHHKVQKCTIDTAAVGSDHFSVWLELSL